MASPNQRKIVCSIEKPKLTGGFFQIKWEWIEDVTYRTGNANATLLWQFLYKNKKDYVFEFSSSYFRTALKIGRRALEKAFADLEINGYLKLREDTKTVYEFIPFPFEMRGGS